jgi:hypothetical protein
VLLLPPPTPEKNKKSFIMSVRIVDERDVLITKNTQTGKLKTTISPQRNKHKQNPHRSGQSSFAASALLSNSAQ